MMFKFKLNLPGKLFMAAVAAWVLGKSSQLRVKGTKQEIDALANALRASRRFNDELKKPGATVESVMQKLGLKHAKGKEFERITGVPWPL